MGLYAIEKTGQTSCTTREDEGLFASCARRVRQVCAPQKHSFVDPVQTNSPGRFHLLWLSRGISFAARWWPRLAFRRRMALVHAAAGSPAISGLETSQRLPAVDGLRAVVTEVDLQGRRLPDIFPLAMSHETDVTLARSAQPGGEPCGAASPNEGRGVFGSNGF